MSLDYKTITIDSKTGHGTVKFIYGASVDFIVFLNEVDQPIVLSERTDEVYLKATEFALQISAQAFKKLDKAHLNDVNDHIQSCLVKALVNDFPIKNLKKIFRPAKKFIASLEPTKLVLARGPNPQHLVYITKSNRVGWYVKSIPDHCNKSLSKLDRLKQLSISLLPALFRETVAVSIGTAVSSVIRSNPGNNFEALIDEAEETLKSRVGEFSYLLYATTALVISIIFYSLMHYFDIPILSYRMAIFGGILGALLSALQRTSPINFSLYESMPSIAYQAAIRVLIGAFSGVIVVVMAEADIAFTLIKGSLHFTFIAGLIAGFAERLIPDMLSSLAKKSELSV